MDTAEYKQLQKNTVSAERQLKDSDLIKFVHLQGTGKRVLFLGNSMLRHGRCEQIGWFGDWGMAASSQENDYVHRLMLSISAEDPEAAFCICQVVEWERQYVHGSTVLELFEDARRFDADIIVMRFVENCPTTDIDKQVFQKELAALLQYLNPSQKATVILTTGFWRHPADDGIVALAKDQHLPLVELGDLGEKDEMKAVGLFEHSGVANHPGDLGMKTMADRIFRVLREYL